MVIDVLYVTRQYMKYVRTMTEDECSKWISNLIAINRLDKFYNSIEWRHLRKEIIEEYHGECLICKQKGFYTKANTVHHKQYVRKHPRYALSKTYVFKDKEYINLIPVCHNCHEELHGYRQKEKKEPLTKERW